ADLAGFELDDDIRQEGRQLAALTPTERSAVEGGLRVRVGNGQLGKILATLGSLSDVRCLLGRLLDLLGSRGLTDRDQDVRYVVLIVFRRRVGLLGQKLVHLARRDADPLQYIALSQQTQRELLAHFLAIGRVIDTLLGEGLRKLG